MAAIEGDSNLNELAKDFEILPNPIITWKKQLLAGTTEIFSSGRERKSASDEVEKATLYRVDQAWSTDIT